MKVSATTPAMEAKKSVLSTIFKSAWACVKKHGMELGKALAWAWSMSKKGTLGAKKEVSNEKRYVAVACYGHPSNKIRTTEKAVGVCGDLGTCGWFSSMIWIPKQFTKKGSAYLYVELWIAEQKFGTNLKFASVLASEIN